MQTVICDPCHGKGVSASSCRKCGGSRLLQFSKCCNGYRATRESCQCCHGGGVLLAGTMEPLPRFKSKNITTADTEAGWRSHNKRVSGFHAAFGYNNNGKPGTSEAPK